MAVSWAPGEHGDQTDRELRGFAFPRSLMSDPWVAVLRR
jgi:hypothetical protein